MKEIFDYIERNLGDIKKLVMSDPRKKVGRARLSVRTLENGWQIEEFVEDKIFHTNLARDAIVEWLKGAEANVFRQHTVYTDKETATFLLSDGGKITARFSKKSEIAVFGHNRAKNYLIKEGCDMAVLRDIGVFTAQNKVVASMVDKFRQINRFIEMIDDVLKNKGYGKNNAEDEGGRALRIIDFGCGKSYLTFTLYHYLTYVRKIDTRITGYDLKKDVTGRSNALAEKYGYKNLDFICGNISDASLSDVDMVISLHACDTATDYALFNAIKAGVRFIFCAPCCQHEVNKEIKSGGEFDIFLKHGIIKERFSALLTDVVRAELLERCGYKTQVLEFVDLGHTPKNLMLRAELKGGKKIPQDLTEIESLLRAYGCSQTLAELLATVKNR